MSQNDTTDALNQLIDKINQLTQDWLGQINETDALDALEAIKIEATGKKGTLSQAMRGLGSLSHEDRISAGKALNEVKANLNTALEAKFSDLRAAALAEKLASEQIDISLPAPRHATGHIHPITKTIEDICDIFQKMGFSVFEGPDIEDDYHNFEALNFSPEHPARQMHDTFYLKNPDTGEADQNWLLRTHTSPGQVRSMQSQDLPIRVIVPGRTFRSDSDITHTPMFHQVEGIVIDKTTHFGHLKGCLSDFCEAFFEIEQVPLKFRASYFPFTEPSAEVDIGYERKDGQLIFGGNKAWMEILGCGMVHPNVLRASGIDPDLYQGFAFGMGVERLAMLKYGIGDLRTFFDSDQHFLSHYGFSPFTPASGLTGLMRRLTLQQNHHKNGAE
ncbi:MAG: phenylalanine--tRNA ligase subunit alpha [Alphaproteobacteria bacterium]